MRGFLSIVLVLAMVLFLAKDMKIYNEVYAGTQEIKNDIDLAQRINEETYDLENGFRLTVREALDSLPKVPHSKKGEMVAREYVCQRIKEWFANYPDYSIYIGYIDPIDYSRAPSIAGEIEPCLNFLHVDLKEKKAMLKDEGLIDFTYGLVGYRIAFMFEGTIHNTGFKVLVPEGTVMG